MVFRLIFRFIFIDTKPDKIILGRWGYHWENNKNIQKYYE